MDIQRMDARQIVMETGMSARPEFYSGRGARLTDLDDRKLEVVYQGIRREQGEEAAGNFAQMVADIPKLTVTDFLLTLYRLEANDWTWNKKLTGKEDGIYVDGLTDAAKVASAFGTLGSVLGRMNEVDETCDIRRDFLERREIKITESPPSRYPINLPDYKPEGNPKSDYKPDHKP